MKINNKIKSIFLLSLVGSGVGQRTSNNQTGVLNNNQLPGIKTNLTDTKITTKSLEQNLLAAGASALFGANAASGIVRNKCTGGFVVVNTNSSECMGGNDYGGFVTSVFCYPSEAGSGLPVTNWDGSVVFGENSYGGPVDNVDFNYVSNKTTTNLQLVPYVPRTTDEGTTDLLPVIGSSELTAPGLSVCVFGATSGYRCGGLTAVNLNLTVPDLWIKGNTWTFNNLGKVDLGTNGLLSEDIGAPVYTETQIGERTLAEALGHISWIDNNDPQHQSFYYTPLEQALTEIKTIFNCDYALLTYNESNAQEYDKLITQIEIPVKK